MVLKVEADCLPESAFSPGLLADSVGEALLINFFSTLVTTADTIVLLKPRTLTK